MTTVYCCCKRVPSAVCNKKAEAELAGYSLNLDVDRRNYYDNVVWLPV